MTKKTEFKISGVEHQEATSLFTEKQPVTTTRHDIYHVILSNNDINTQGFFQAGQEYYLSLNGHGDCLKSITMRLRIPCNNVALAGTINNSILDFVDHVDFMLQERVISRLTWDYILHYYETALTLGQKQSLLTQASLRSAVQGKQDDDIVECLLPLPFWFWENAGRALPLCAFTHQAVSLRYVLRNNDDPEIAYDFNQCQVDFLCEFIMLSPEEKPRFSQPSTYCIEQVQTDTSATRVLAVNEIPPQEWRWEVPKSSFVKELVVIRCRSDAPGVYALDNAESVFQYEAQAPIQRRMQLLINGDTLIDTDDPVLWQRQTSYLFYNSEGSMIRPSDRGTHLIDLERPSLRALRIPLSLNPVDSGYSGGVSLTPFTNVTLALSGIVRDPDAATELRVYVVKSTFVRIQDGAIDLCAHSGV
jgi:hypothetical protein